MATTGSPFPPLRTRPVQALLVRGTRSLATDLDLPRCPAFA
ncbi:hypothetical protein ACTWLT_22500 [Micromonospora sp. ZYX-F-536]